MKKSEYYVGRKLRFAPAITADGQEIDSTLEIATIHKASFGLKHLATGLTLEFFTDRIVGFDAPDILNYRGQIVIENGVLIYKTGLHPKNLQAELRRLPAPQLKNFLAEMGLLSMKNPMQEIDGELQAIIREGKSAKAVADLKAKRLTAKDPASLQISLILLAWHDPKESTPQEGIELCEYGMLVARKLDNVDCLAVLRSHAAVHRTSLYLDKRLESWVLKETERRVGISTRPERDLRTSEATALLKLIGEDLTFAYEVCRSTQDTQLVSSLVSSRLSVFGLIGGQNLKLEGDASTEVREVMSTFRASKDFFEANKDPLGLAYLYHNAANQLRFLGMKDEALGLAEAAVKHFDELGDNEALKKSVALLERLRPQS